MEKINTPLKFEENEEFKNKEVFFKEIHECIKNNPNFQLTKRKNPLGMYNRTVKPYRQNKTQRTVYGDELIIDLTKVKKE
jgi:hypothetical protein